MKHLAVSLRVGVIASYDLVATSEGSFRHVLLRVSGWWSLQPEDAGSERGNHCHRMGIGRIKGKMKKRSENTPLEGTLTFRRVKLSNSSGALTEITKNPSVPSIVTSVTM